jgi:glycosyltransferase involved in cell wall biosynthesis
MLETLVRILSPARMNMKPLHVYFIVPRIDRIGGYENQALTLGRALLKDPSVQLHVVTDTPSEQCSHLPASIRAVSQHLPSGSIIRQYRSFDQQFRHAPAGASVVHAHALYRFSAVGLLAALRLRCPTLLKLPTERDAKMLFQSYRPAMWIFRPVLTRVDAFVCPSQAIAAELQPHLVRASRAVCLPNAVDTKRFCPADDGERQELKRKLGIPFERVILFAGRHVKRKGGDLLLRAVSLCRQALPARTGVVFLGDGDQKPSWQRLAHELELAERVVFFDGNSSPEQFYRAANAFVLPSLYEGMPNVLLEAMACGLPCLASRIGGVTDIFGERFDDQLIPVEDIDALAVKLPRLLQENARRVGAEMREHVLARYSVETVSRQLVELYRELLVTG